MSFPPLSDPLNALDAAVAAVDAADAHLRQVTHDGRRRLATAVAALGPPVRALASDERPPAERDALAHRLYWHYLRVPVREIVVGLGFSGHAELLDAVGSFDTGVPCDDCGRTLKVATRTQLYQVKPEGRRPSHARQRVSCADCLRLHRAAEAARWALAERRDRAERYDDTWPPGPLDEDAAVDVINRVRSDNDAADRAASSLRLVAGFDEDEASAGP